MPTCMQISATFGRHGGVPRCEVRGEVKVHLIRQAHGFAISYHQGMDLSRLLTT